MENLIIFWAVPLLLVLPLAFSLMGKLYDSLSNDSTRGKKLHKNSSAECKETLLHDFLFIIFTVNDRFSPRFLTYTSSACYKNANLYASLNWSHDISDFTIQFPDDL